MKRYETFEYFCPQHHFPIWGDGIKQLYLKLVLHLQAKHGLDENQARKEAKIRLAISAEEIK